MFPSVLELPPIAIAVLVIFAAKVAYDLLSRHAISFSYPPGPKPKFLIGNALDLPKNGSHRVFAEWGKKYDSDILHASAFGTHIVVINSFKMAEEMLEKRAQLYSDRPVVPIVELMGWGDIMTMMRYGNAWRRHRKMCWQIFRPEAARRYHPMLINRVHFFLRSMLREPERVFEHNKLLSISLTMLMMYGHAPETLDDPIIHIADEAVNLASTLFRPGCTLINILPILRHIPSWVPGTTGRRLAEKTRKLTDEVKRLPLEDVITQMKAGTLKPSFVGEFLERKATVGASDEEENAVKNIAWTVYGGASDTTISATGTFLYLISKHPEVQRKAQEEIDRVVGTQRLPEMNDRPDLPYIEAIYREVLRYGPPAPGGVPHAVVEDDVVGGYFIPKGAMVIPNIWAMTHDETCYPDPFSFKPERFFDTNGNLNNDSRVLAYGFGRRICVGKAVASDTMWLIIASFLASFDIGKAKDEYGQEIELDDTFIETGSMIHKKPFKCHIMPRSGKVRGLIEHTTDH